MSDHRPAAKERIAPNELKDGPMLKPPSPGTVSGQSIPEPAGAIDPISLARRDLKKSLPRRFYKGASVGELNGAYGLLLDGRAAKTPGGNPLVLPSLAAAEALAGEWSAQGDSIDPESLPLTRIVNSAIDGVACQLDATAGEIAKYASADLVCYRASGPKTLVEAQAAAWDKVLSFARDKLGAEFICAEGVMLMEQPKAARAAVANAVRLIASTGEAAPFALAALHVMTTLTRSVLIALAVAHGEVTPSGAWSAAHVDEDFEMRAWGEDAEALERRARQWREMEAAARLFQAVNATGS
ncbi:MAG: ATPase [Beijerinckiaceae bacterium]|nr:ATPase [Beijerinckiaceae bacterium]